MKRTRDVIVVGAGPAGITAAYVLAKAGLDVVVLERGDYPGAKNMFGGVLYGRALHQVLPDFWDRAPVERRITRRVITALGEGASLSVDHANQRMAVPPYNGFSVQRSRFDRWYADQAVEAGAVVVPQTVVDGVLEDNGQVVGVKVRRPEGELRASVVIAADGVNSLLAQRAGLHRGKPWPKHFSLGAKEVVALPRKTIEERFGLEEREGAAFEFFGRLAGEAAGGAFLYTNLDTVSVGVVTNLASPALGTAPIYEILEAFKQHPLVRGRLKDGVVREYSAHLIPEAGVNMMPKLYKAGMLVVGDAAGLVLVTGLQMEGANYAISSGLAAAEAVREAASRGDFGESRMARYQELLQESYVLKNLRRFRRAHELLQNPRMMASYPDLVCRLAEEVFVSDPTPRNKLLPMALRVARRNGGLRGLVRDGLQFGRTLLW